MKGNDATYAKSNEIVEVSLQRLRGTEYNNLLKDNNRKKDGQALLDYLCDKFHMPKTTLSVSTRPQPHSTNSRGSLRSKTYGFYRPATMGITIYNVTAVKHQEISIKVFADTLLHEFMHHYDMTHLRLSATLHTAGFYKRISDLQAKLAK